jgi:hypothetical protein
MKHSTKYDLMSSLWIALFFWILLIDTSIENKDMKIIIEILVILIAILLAVVSDFFQEREINNAKK